MTIAAVSVVIAACSVVAASTFYSFQIRNLRRTRKTDLAMRLYATWDSLEFMEAFHEIYWADTRNLDSLLESLGGRRYVGSYVFSFYDQIGALLLLDLIDIEVVDELLGNSTKQIWEKVENIIREIRRSADDPRLYENFEYLYDVMCRSGGEVAHRRAYDGRTRKRRQERDVARAPLRRKEAALVAGYRAEAVAAVEAADRQPE